MSALALAGALFAVGVAVLAVFAYPLVTLVPRLGAGYLYRLPRLRLLAALLSLGFAGAAYLLAGTRLQAVLLGVVVVLTPLSGFLRADRLFVPVDDPRHLPADDAGLPPDASVVGVVVDGSAHAWAVDTLVPHHVVNDEVGGRPVAAAWCAYCASGIVYDATVDGERFAFEPLAVLRRNMAMRDRETGTIWQHATGEALSGPLAGTELEVLGGRLTTWRAWREAHPGTTLAEEPEAWSGLLPKKRTIRLAVGTERVAVPGVESTDRRLPFTEEVVGVEVGGAAKAYPLTALRERGSVGDVVGGIPVTVSYDPDADRADVVSGGEPVEFQRTRWMGWFEFHPETAVYGRQGE